MENTIHMAGDDAILYDSPVSYLNNIIAYRRWPEPREQ